MDKSAYCFRLVRLCQQCQRFFSRGARAIRKKKIQRKKDTDATGSRMELSKVWLGLMKPDDTYILTFIVQTSAVIFAKATKDRTQWHKIKVNYGRVEWDVVHDVSMSASFARSTKRVSRAGSYKSSSVSAWTDASKNRSEIVEEYRSVFRKKKVDEDAWRT
ncbi:hypothetical protein V1478_017874 [Vespula squamosa]|uniref:Uncharacterized protein n=1 Tax=Vespula squamosa TaxID=30214 RepID=A0ABD1ZVF6_VESSQ